ncbi:MAG: acylphosphatase [Bauldia sp.]|nr:acylphosphatase [Bauldia sp.]
MAERAVHVVIVGRVQGVGFRAWIERETASRRLAGWVRNRRDASVEAVFVGGADAVDAMIAACRRGPPASLVAEVRVADYAGPALSRFTVLPTE